VKGPLLEIQGLSVHFATSEGPIEAVDGLDLYVNAGEILGLVGESGSGKSVTALAILRLIRPPGRIVGGAIRFEGRDLLGLSEHEMRSIRGSAISLVSQSPRTALNPLIPVGRQISRLFALHGGIGGWLARQKTFELLDLVGISEPRRRASQYPHQLSGGTCQRVMIAMAIATSPKIIIADEPTTGLDVSIAARVLDLLRNLASRTGAAIILITHDLGVVAETCHRVAVMHAGQLAETAPNMELFHNPAHPYTRALMRAIPRIDADLKLEPISGSVPSLLRPPPGCRYQNRCPERMEVCRVKPPAFVVAPEHSAACFAVEKRLVAA
jgi:oligopeptide/dipeptide ABC transporter ATP-binding protein